MTDEVMVVDDAIMMRTVIRTVAESTSQFRVVATASNGKEALKHLARERGLSKSELYRELQREKARLR